MPLLTDLKLPQYNVTLTIPTTYSGIILGRIKEQIDQLYEVFNLAEDHELLNQIHQIDYPSPNKELSNGISIEMHSYTFTSPWQLASDLCSILYYTIKDRIELEQSLSLIGRSDLEEAVGTIDGIHEAVTEEPTHYSIRNISSHIMEENNREAALEELDKEEAEHDEALRAAAPYSPSSEEHRLAADFSQDNNEAGTAQIAAEEAAEVAMHEDALRAAAPYSPSSEEHRLAAGFLSQVKEEVELDEYLALAAFHAQQNQAQSRADAETSMPEIDYSIGASPAAVRNEEAQNNSVPRSSAPFSPRAEELALATPSSSQDSDVDQSAGVVLAAEDPDDPIEEFTPTQAAAPEASAAAPASVQAALPAPALSLTAALAAAGALGGFVSSPAAEVMNEEAPAEFISAAGSSASLGGSRSGSQISDISAAGAGAAAGSDRASTKSATSEKLDILADHANTPSSQLSKEHAAAGAGAPAGKEIVGPHTAALLSEVGRKRNAAAAGLARAEDGDDIENSNPKLGKRSRVGEVDKEVVVERLSRRLQERRFSELYPAAAVLAADRSQAQPGM